MIFSCALCWKQHLNISRNKIKFLKLPHVNRNVCLYASARVSQNSGHCQNKTRVQAGDLNARFVCVDISVEDIDDFIDHFFSGFVGGLKHFAASVNDGTAAVDQYVSGFSCPIPDSLTGRLE